MRVEQVYVKESTHRKERGQESNVYLQHTISNADGLLDRREERMEDDENQVDDTDTDTDDEDHEEDEDEDEMDDEFEDENMVDDSDDEEMVDDSDEGTTVIKTAKALHRVFLRQLLRRP